MMRRSLLGGVAALFMGGRTNKNTDVFELDFITKAQHCTTGAIMPAMELCHGIGAVDTLFEIIKRFSPTSNEFVNVTYVSMDKEI